MTSSDNEKLIEEAAKAIWAATDALTWEQTSEDLRDSCRVEARAALAVFEKAHTPTDDEREGDEKAILNALYDSRESFTGVGAEVGTDETAILVDYVPEIVLALGFRRSGATEPQGEPSDAPEYSYEIIRTDIISALASDGFAYLEAEGLVKRFEHHVLTSHAFDPVTDEDRCLCGLPVDSPRHALRAAGGVR